MIVAVLLLLPPALIVNCHTKIGIIFDTTKYIYNFFQVFFYFPKFQRTNPVNCLHIANALTMFQIYRNINELSRIPPIEQSPSKEQVNKE